VKVIILGKGEGWENAPLTYQDKEVQCWGLNNHIMSRPLDVVFEPHDVEWWKEHCAEDSWYHKKENRYLQHIDRVNELGVPYLTLKHYDFIPTSRAYPVEEICDHFGVDYFTGGIDYMMAYAIWSRAKSIDVYGVHTDYDDEYQYQKPSLEFWIGVAVGRMINVVIHGSHSLLKPMYQNKIYTNEGKEADGLRYGYFTPQRKFPITQ
jgi:hypothetical protein